MSGLIDKVKNAVSSDKPSQPEGTHGTHQSRVANAADPRIDSDRDHRARQDLGRTENLSTGTGAYNTTGSSTGAYGTDTRPFNTTDGPATKTDGPHKSNVLNKADPRVDSDRDHSRNMGANPHGTSGTGAHNVHSETTQFGSGTHGTHSEGLRSQGLGSEGYSSNIPEGTHGPHGSRVANAADPRVDSDLDRTRHTGTHGGITGENLTSGTHGTHGTHHGTENLGTSGNTFGSSTIGSSNTHRGENLGTTGGAFGSSTTHRGENLGTSGETYGTSGTTGHNTLGSSGHNTLGSSTHRGENLGTSGETYGTTGHNTLGSSGHNTLGSSTTHNTTSRHQGSSALGSGPAPNTAGPHKSDMMNKMDPRVDSNLDGSKTVGGDKTFSRSNETGSAYTHKDPTDAAQVPPSVLKKHVGEPVVQHDHHEHDHARRHSVSHQEQHRGL